MVLMCGANQESKDEEGLQKVASGLSTRQFILDVMKSLKH